MQFNNNKYLKKQAKELPKLTLDQLAQISSIFSYRDRSADFENGYVGARYSVANSNAAFAELMSKTFSFHTDASGQLYVVCKDDTLRLVEADGRDLGKLIHQTAKRYNIAIPQAVSVSGVYSALLEIPEITASISAPTHFFHPEQWDGVHRLREVLTKFFRLDPRVAEVNTLAMLTTLFQWYAVMTGQPGAGFSVSPVLMSTEQGIGKSHYVRLLGELDEEFKPLMISGWGDLKDNAFTALLPTTSLVFYDEMGASALRRHIDSAKRIATSEYWVINQKYIRSYQLLRTQPLFFSTNNESVLPDEANRRFPVIRVSINPDSPLATNDVAGAKEFLQQVLNEVAVVYNRATAEERLILTKWKAEYNADDVDDDYAEVLEVFNHLVVNCHNEAGGVTAGQLWDTANVNEANILLSYFCRHDVPLLPSNSNQITRDEIGRHLKRYLPKYALVNLISAYNPLVSVSADCPVISPNARKSNGRRVRDICLENHRHFEKTKQLQIPPLYDGDEHQASSRLAEYSALLDDLMARDVAVIRNGLLYDARIWCAVKVVKDELKEGHGAFQKVPVSALSGMPLAGGYGSPQRNGQLTDYQTVLNFIENQSITDSSETYHVGLHIDENTPLVALDIDNGALDISQLPSGVGVEYSVSGKGMHVFALASLDEKYARERYCLQRNSFVGDFEGLDAEMYSNARVITMSDPSVLENITDEALWWFDFAAQTIDQENRRQAQETKEVMEMRQRLASSNQTDESREKALNTYSQNNGLSFEEGRRNNDSARLFGFVKKIGMDPQLAKSWILKQTPDWDGEDELDSLIARFFEN